MREIKFKAWDKKENKWYEPEHAACEGKLHELLLGFGGDLSDWTMNGLGHESTFPDRYILVQYTGIKDKNGKEIYDGYILKYGEVVGDLWNFEKIKTVGIVEWYDSGFKAREIETNKRGGRYVTPFSQVVEPEVIGNKFENPELLEGK